MRCFQCNATHTHTTHGKNRSTSTCTTMTTCWSNVRRSNLKFMLYARTKSTITLTRETPPDGLILYSCQILFPFAYKEKQRCCIAFVCRLKWVWCLEMCIFLLVSGIRRNCLASFRITALCCSFRAICMWNAICLPMCTLLYGVRIVRDIAWQATKQWPTEKRFRMSHKEVWYASLTMTHSCDAGTSIPPCSIHIST